MCISGLWISKYPVEISIKPVYMSVVWYGVYRCCVHCKCSYILFNYEWIVHYFLHHNQVNCRFIVFGDGGKRVQCRVHCNLVHFGECTVCNCNHRSSSLGSLLLLNAFEWNYYYHEADSA